jgi:nucleoside-diphosphate-sugar epimerase
MKRILVTGVGGNVGQYLAQRLYMAGYSVIGTYRNNQPESVEYDLLHTDLAETEMEIKNIDTVIHVAGRIAGSTDQLVTDNIKATMNLIHFAETHNVKKFVYMSTVSVYGDVEKELRIDGDICNPSIYGCTKYLAENLVKEANIPIKLVIGLPRMLGPFVDMEHTQDSGILTMVKKIMRDEDVVCYIPKVRYNTYMHVSDLADFVVAFLQKEANREYEKVLLAVRDRLYMTDIMKIIKEAAQSKSKIIIEDQGIMPHCASVSIEKALEMGYTPKSAKEVWCRFVNEIKEKGMEI